MAAASKDECDRLILECVNSGLAFVLGKNGTRAILFHIEKDFKIGFAEIPNRFSDFLAALNHIFGKATPLLESYIRMELEKRTNTQLPHDFQQAIAIVRETFRPTDGGS